MVESNMFRETRNLGWGVLRLAKLDGIVSTVLCAVVPSEYAKRCHEHETTLKKERDAEILKGLGELTLQAHLGQVELDPKMLDAAWDAIKAKDTGVEFTDVFNPHKAKVLDVITPTLN